MCIDFSMESAGNRVQQMDEAKAGKTSCVLRRWLGQSNPLHKMFIVSIGSAGRGMPGQQADCCSPEHSCVLYFPYIMA